MTYRDPLYSGLEAEIVARLHEEERTSPTAYVLRRQCIDLYHREPIGSTNGEMALRVVDYLNVVITEGRDLDPANAANLRGSLGLLQR